MSYKPGDLYFRGFTTSDPTTGAAKNADSLPVATANRNGTDVPAFVLSVANLDTGRYIASGTIPSSYASGDVLNVSVAATVGGVAGKAFIDRLVLDSKRLSDLVLPAAIYSGRASNGGANTMKLDAGASGTSNLYVGLLVQLTGGTGAGQVRTVTSYNGNSNQITVDRNWATNPDSSTTYSLLPADGAALNANLQVTANVPSAAIAQGTAAAGSANTITLAAGSATTNGAYVGNTVSITAGTGLGQSRTIVGYAGSTRVATVSPGWATTPDATSVYVVLANVTPSQFSAQGVATAATSTSLTLDSNASATAGLYVGSFLTILSGTGAGQTGTITAYTSGRIATVTPAWGTTPDTTSAYAVIPVAAQSPTSTAPSDPLAVAVPGAYAPGTAGFLLGNMDAAVSTRSTYAGGPVASVTGAVGSVTAPVTAGTVTDKTGYSLTQAFPANFAVMLISGAGAVTVGTNQDKSGYSLATPVPTAAQVATAVWADTNAGDFAAAGSPGKVLVGQLGGAFGPGTSVYTAAALANAPTGTGGGGGGDPWATALPGSYAAGTAGAILGGRLDVAVSTRAPASTALSTADWTASRASNLDNLDARVSTRSTYAGGDTPGTITLVGLLTPTRAANLDRLDAPVSSRSTYAGTDTPGTVTLVGLLTPQRADNLDFLDVAVSTRSTYAGGAVASVTAPVTVGAITDKSGYSLGPGGLDAISTTPPAGVATTYREMAIATWMRWYGRSTKDAGTGLIRTYAANGTTVLTTQPYSDDGAGNEVLGESS